MRIAMSGSTGFIGSSLQEAFACQGWETIPLTRADFKGDWAPLRDKISRADAVINLAGAPIARHWTESYKNELYQSRIPVTGKIVDAMSGLRAKPKAFISACGVGIYPDGGPFTEYDKSRAQDFLGELAQDWESTALKARDAGVRTIVFRFGMVLGRGGGALARLLPVFRLGLGGRLGSGKQPLSWVHIRDLCRAHIFALEHDSVQGCYNLTAPEPTTNNEFTASLAHVLKRPAMLPVPALALELIFGEGASAFIGGQSVLPQRLTEEGFLFQFENVDSALENLLWSR